MNERYIQYKSAIEENVSGLFLMYTHKHTNILYTPVCKIFFFFIPQEKKNERATIAAAFIQVFMYTVKQARYKM